MTRRFWASLMAGLVIAVGLGMQQRSMSGRRLESEPEPAPEPAPAQSMTRSKPLAFDRTGDDLGGRAMRQRPGLAPAHDEREPSPVGLAQDDVLAQWVTEELDQRATDEFTTYVADAFGDLEVDGDIDDLMCRKTLCRINVHFADLSHAQRFEAEAGMGERRRRMSMSITDGVVDVEVYLARE